MKTLSEKMVRTVASRFDLDGTVLRTEPFGHGHINDTFLVFTAKEPYILQRVNQQIFQNPEQVMENIYRVTEHIRQKETRTHRDPRRCVLTLIPARDGALFYADENGDFWRTYLFIDGLSLDLPETPQDFFNSARAFGRFQQQLADFPAETLHETLPHFHDTPHRLVAFEKAVTADACHRAASAAPEIEFILNRRPFMSVLEDAHRQGVLPYRVTHNDTKLNNVLLDRETREPLCVLDLDTVMPGYSVNDFGDSIRFGASTALEDERDLDKVHLDLSLFRVYTRGFLQPCRSILTEEERLLLPEGAKMMMLECGMRFLADYLSGDTYFKTNYPDHNLVRCRTQLKLVAETEKYWDQLKQTVKKESSL